MSINSWKAVSLLSVVGLCGSGCVHRTLTVQSNPPAALVYMNDQEIGRTPVTREFTWYGTYDMELRLAGYQSIKTKAPVIAPWWQWVPFDFFAELFPVTDHHHLAYTMRPPAEEQEDPDLIVLRGEELRGELHSSQVATTRPTTRPAHRPKNRPATRPDW